mmetsp:Transcript_1371/g.3683  ORF Transcript_1371/g.3683 Transcript_1371/m.3683 type:complete len:863 (+) Transcript_1371:71-2659(+)
MSRPQGPQNSSCEAESFHKLCSFLESLHLKKKEDKLSTLANLVSRFSVTCDLFPLMRLLLPGIDSERSTYGLKESNLAKLYGDMLALPEGQKHRLLHWKDPALQEGYKCAAGDFPSVLYSVVEARATVRPGSSSLTIADVNAALDRIHHAGDMPEKKRQLLDLVRRASAMEQKWVVKMILKDLKLGFSHESFLKRFHPDAMELYNRSSMLRQVLDEIRAQYMQAGKSSSSSAMPEGGGNGDPRSSEAAMHGGSADGKTILFSKFKPMLAQRLPFDQIGIKLNGEKLFCLETKYDGERILVHIDRDARRVELYTRNAIDYTSQYAPSGSMMRNILLANVKGRQIVLDGEMLAWDEDEEAFIPFGSNRSVAQGADPRKHLCYMAFDVLYYMDKDGDTFDLRRTKLEARREFLAKIIEPQQRRLEVSNAIMTTKASEVQARLEGAIEAREEGLMIKDATSKYWHNARKRGWYKVKPEYDGMTETLDLLVVGATFGDSARRRQGLGTSQDLADNVSQFLLAVLAGDGKQGDTVITVARVGTGYSMEKLKEIRDRLRPHLRRYDPKRAPAWLGGWRGSAKSKPDVLVDRPAHGFVMEVKAAEIVPSEDFAFGHTLRFPRAVVHIREDKDWSDACTEKDLSDFLRGGRNTLTARRLKAAKVEVHSEGEDTDPDGAPKKTPPRATRARVAPRRGTSFGVLDGFRAADTAHVDVASELLKGAEVFVLNGDAQYGKPDLEAFIVRHAGKVVQNFIAGRTSLVVAATMEDLRAQNLAKMAKVDILKYEYLFDCESAGKMLDMQPRYLLSIGAETQKKLSAAYDKFGDAYCEETTAEALQSILKSIPPAELRKVSSDTLDSLLRHPRLAAILS